MLTDTDDLWGWSKDVLFYLRHTTLRVVAGGGAVITKRSNIGRVVHEMTSWLNERMTHYASLGQYPVNMPFEVRLCGVDDDGEVLVDSAGVPDLSAVRPRADRQDWDTAIWMNVVSIPGTAGLPAFLREMERWMVANYSGDYATFRPGGSKGWAFTDQAAYQDDEIPHQHSACHLPCRWRRELGLRSRHSRRTRPAPRIQQYVPRPRIATQLNLLLRKRFTPTYVGDTDTLIVVTVPIDAQPLSSECVGYLAPDGLIGVRDHVCLGGFVAAEGSGDQRGIEIVGRTKRTVGQVEIGRLVAETIRILHVEERVRPLSKGIPVLVGFGRRAFVVDFGSAALHAAGEVHPGYDAVALEFGEGRGEALEVAGSRPLGLLPESVVPDLTHYCVDLSAEFVVLEAALDTVSGGFADFVERSETWDYQFACLLTYGDDVGLTEHRC